VSLAIQRTMRNRQ